MQLPASLTDDTESTGVQLIANFGNQVLFSSNVPLASICSRITGFGLGQMAIDVVPMQFDERHPTFDTVTSFNTLVTKLAADFPSL
jgi:hypothetical protein